MLPGLGERSPPAEPALSLHSTISVSPDPSAGHRPNGTWGQLLKSHPSLEKSARRANTLLQVARLHPLLSRLSSAYSALPTKQWREERKPFEKALPGLRAPPAWTSLAQHRQVTWGPAHYLSPPQLERSAPQPEDHAPSIARMLMAPQALVHVEFVLGVI